MKYKRKCVSYICTYYTAWIKYDHPYFFVRFSCGVFGKKVLHFTVYPIGDHGCTGRRTQHILLGKTCK